MAAPSKLFVLANLASLRRSHQMTRATLASLTDMTVHDLRALELCSAEPWFDNALSLSMTLRVPIERLIAAGDLEEAATNPRLDPRFFERDTALWSSGQRISLSVAYRLAVRLNLPSMNELHTPAYERQLWATLEAGERSSGVIGSCPWCRASITSGEPHTALCAPNNRWGLRGIRPSLATSGVDAARPAARGRRRGATQAWGLKALRDSLGLTQSEMADRILCHVNHYSQLERGALPLTIDRADTIITMFDVTRAQLYARPVEIGVSMDDDLPDITAL